MDLASVSLAGTLVRLEPLSRGHIAALVEAGSGDRSIYRWSLTPNGNDQVSRYVDLALAARDAGTALPFAIVRQSDNLTIGSTRFFDLERWAWPADHPRHGRKFPDGCEVGYTWLAPPAIRTGANTEAKLLMLEYAFETWQAFRVCFHTDRRNDRSRAALERIGATFEGVLRSHRMAVDFTPRDSCRYSIVAGEWPPVKSRLVDRLSASPKRN